MLSHFNKDLKCGQSNFGLHFNKDIKFGQNNFVIMDERNCFGILSAVLSCLADKSCSTLQR